MMTSFPENIPAILRAIAEVRPRSILDVGVGFGKFGLMAKELMAAMDAENGDMKPVPIQVNCCEGARYFQRIPWHLSLYDNHYHIPAETLPPDIYARHDLILAIDVIEHMERETWAEFMRRVKGLRDVPLLISTPKTVTFYKEHYYGLDCPRHVTQFVAGDFSPKHDFSTPQSFIHLL